MNNQKNESNSNSEKKKTERQTYTDYNIFSGLIKLVSEDGKSCVLDRDDAIAIAKERGMNLVQIAYNKNSNPKSICKIINYGKFRFEQKKREKENLRKSRLANAEAKEIIFSIRIDDGDYNHKIKQITNFIVEDKTKVKITIKLSKREMAVKHLATELMKKILNNFNNIAVMDGSPIDDGRTVGCTIKPMK